MTTSRALLSRLATRTDEHSRRAAELQAGWLGPALSRVLPFCFRPRGGSLQFAPRLTRTPRRRERESAWDGEAKRAGRLVDDEAEHGWLRRGRRFRSFEDMIRLADRSSILVVEVDQRLRRFRP